MPPFNAEVQEQVTQGFEDFEEAIDVALDLMETGSLDKALKAVVNASEIARRTILLSLQSGFMIPYQEAFLTITGNVSKVEGFDLGLTCEEQFEVKKATQPDWTPGPDDLRRMKLIKEAEERDREIAKVKADAFAKTAKANTPEEIAKQKRHKELLEEKQRLEEELNNAEA